MLKCALAAFCFALVTPALAEGPAAGPSSQGGDKADVAPTGVEKPLEPKRVVPDASEEPQPSANTDAPNELEEPKVKAEQEPEDNSQR